MSGLYKLGVELTEERVVHIAHEIMKGLCNREGDLIEDTRYGFVYVDHETGDGFQMPDQVMDYLLVNDLISMDEYSKHGLH